MVIKMDKRIIGCIGVIITFLGLSLGGLYAESIEVGLDWPIYVGYTGFILLIIGVILMLYGIFILEKLQKISK